MCVNVCVTESNRGAPQSDSIRLKIEFDGIFSPTR
jgi:hypothetical protein